MLGYFLELGYWCSCEMSSGYFGRVELSPEAAAIKVMAEKIRKEDAKISSTSSYKSWDICLICRGMGSGFKNILVEREDQNARASATICAICYMRMKKMKGAIPVFSNKIVEVVAKDLD